MPEASDTPRSTDYATVRERRDILLDMLPRFNYFISAASTLTRGDSVNIDEISADLRNFPQNEALSFWGRLLDRFPNAHFTEKTGVITTLMVGKTVDENTEARNEVADAWESMLHERGVNCFAASNIRNEADKRFWENRGYVPDGSDKGGGIPYSMGKQLPPFVPEATT